MKHLNGVLKKLRRTRFAINLPCAISPSGDINEAYDRLLKEFEGKGSSGAGLSESCDAGPATAEREHSRESEVNKQDGLYSLRFSWSLKFSTIQNARLRLALRGEYDCSVHPGPEPVNIYDRGFFSNCW